MATTTAVPRVIALPKRRFGGDQVAYAFTFLFACSIIVVTVALVWQLWVHSSPALQKFGFGFLTSSLWNPVTD